MTTCSKCGTQSESNAIFCGECGADLQQKVVSASSSQITKRPVIITIVCCYFLLITLIAIYSLKNYFNGNSRDTLMSIVGEKNYYISLVCGIISIFLIIPIIGIWKMKKNFAYIFVGVYLLLITSSFISDTIPYNSELQKFAVIGPIIALSILFTIILHVIINNPKTETSNLRKKQFGIILGIIGIVLIIISMNVTFTISRSYDLYDTNKQLGLPDAFNNHMRGTDTNIDIVKKNLFLFTGLFTLLSGVLFFVLGLNTKINNNLAKSDKTVSVGQSQQTNDIVLQIEKLNELVQKGLLSKEEFEMKKTELISRM